MSDHFLTHTQQVAIEVEGTKGTAETLVAADVQLRPFTTDNPFTPEHDRREIPEAADDIGQAIDEVGGAKGRIAFSTILQTSGALGTAPALADFLKGCGLKEQTVLTITCGAPSGGDSEFAAGETYSATGGKTGIIEADLTGAGTLRYIVTSGGALADTDVVTANGDSATCTATTGTYGVKYTPRSTGQETVTIQRGEQNSEDTADQDYLWRLKGAMGNFSLALRPGHTADFVSEFLGVVDLMGAGNLLTGYTIESRANRPKFVSATVQLAGVTLKVGEVTFDQGNQLEIDPDPSRAEAYHYAEVANRQPTIAISPRRQKPSEFDDLGYLSSETTLAAVLTLGTVEGKIVRIQAPAAQVRAWSPEERVGRRCGALTLNLTRDSIVDHEYSIYFQ